MIRLRTDSSLSDLTEDQQAQIYDWLQTLGYTGTIEKLAQPEPDGFTLKTHRASLHRFFVRYSMALKERDVADASALTSETKSSAPALQSGAEEALHHAAFQLSTAPLDPESFNHVSRWLIRQKTLEQKARHIQIAENQLALARDRLALDREKMELNYARLALKYALELHQINTHPGWDDEDKVRAARDKLFPKPQQ